MSTRPTPLPALSVRPRRRGATDGDVGRRRVDRCGLARARRVQGRLLRQCLHEPDRRRALPCANRASGRKAVVNARATGCWLPDRSGRPCREMVDATDSSLPRGRRSWPHGTVERRSADGGARDRSWSPNGSCGAREEAARLAPAAAACAHAAAVELVAPLAQPVSSGTSTVTGSLAAAASLKSVGR